MKKLWILVSLVLIGCLGCVAKPVYELPTAVGFRMGDKTQITSLEAADKFLIEDDSDADSTQYTTLDDINTYLGSIYQPLTAYLTDLGDGNITSNFVNTAHPWADNEMADNHTMGSGGTIHLTPIQTACTNDFHNIGGTDDDVPDAGDFGAGTDLDSNGAVAWGNLAEGELADSSVTGADIKDDSVDSADYAAGSVDNEHLASGINATKIADGTVTSTEFQYINSLTGNVETALNVRCLESVFGTSIDASLLKDGTVLKASAILQKYHGVDPSADVLAMMGSANDTALVTEIGAEPALTNEAAFYARIADVSQFFEPGDNVTTFSCTLANLPSTCSVGQCALVTDADTDGSWYGCVSTNIWKDMGMGPDKDKIEEGDSTVEVIDIGTGRVDIDIDGNLKVRVSSTGLDVIGTVTAEGYNIDATSSPRVRALDSDCPGTDKFAGSIDWQYVDGADGAENSDICLKSQEGGANTTQAKFDESETIWELNGNFLELPNGTADVALPQVGAVHFNETDEQLSFHSGTNGEISGEASISLIYHRTWSFDPDAVCDGAVDRLFLMTIGDDAPEGITIDEWKLSFEADPTTEADLDLKRADAFIGVANAAVMDVIDTTNGVSSEDNDTLINSDAVVANSKVMYLEFGTAYTETTHQIIFELWYHLEED